MAGARWRFYQVVDFMSCSRPRALALFPLLVWLTIVVPAEAGQRPAVESVTPVSGSGSSETFSYHFSDADGADDISSVVVVINGSPGGTNGCVVFFAPAVSQFFLLD